MPDNAGVGVSESVEKLEAQLNSFSAAERQAALEELAVMVDSGQLTVVPKRKDTNVHYHTFFSYNSSGFSPSRVAWEATKLGLAAGGIVDFDVFDGLEEFYAAARRLNLKGSVGMETRVFVPEFADQVINSPGEPGISYHMGAGFPSAEALAGQEAFCERLRSVVANRNRDLLERVNGYLDRIALDYEKDVLTLTPAGSATERHICLAYARKARAVFDDDVELANYWTEKLETDISGMDLPEGGDLLTVLRAKTMKRGGVGYVPPDAGSFPTMAEVNAFVLATGGIPMLTWLDGTSDGEQDMERLLEVAMAGGAAAVNIIPDRNYTPGLGKSDRKCRNLYDFVAMAQVRDLPIIAGTEMNGPGQKLVDNFESEELQPLVETFLQGSLVMYAHATLQRQAGLGYTSAWATKHFDSRAAKNNFYVAVGEALEPSDHEVLQSLDKTVTPQMLLDKIQQ